jgi:predicted small lipoprotein YifL
MIKLKLNISKIGDSMGSIVNTFRKARSLTLTCTLAAATLAITACGEKPPKPPLPKTEHANLFQQQHTELEQAKKAGQTGEKNAEELKQNVKQQTK